MKASPMLALMLLILPVVFASAAAQLPAGFQEDLLVYGLNLPTVAEYVPDGRLFILEKGGRIRIFKNGQLLTKPFLTLPVDTLSERGLLGLAFDPQFAVNHYVYVYDTSGGSDPKNQVERFTANGDIADVSSRKMVITGINSDAGFHNAGCVHFGPDGKLYISTGDGGLNPSLAQDKGSLNGKILRVNPDGSIPSDNPFSSQSGTRGEIWAYGFRNPWRFAIHPSSGQVAIGDVGEDNYEELNLGVPGANYGWPQSEGPTTNSAFTTPYYFYDHSTGGAAVVAGVFYTGTKFPGKYRNSFFFTDYVRGFIKYMHVQSGTPPVAETLATGITSPVHMLQSPDGSLLYVSINTGEIRKIHYVGGKNRPPVAEAKSSKRSGPIPLTVRFSSEGSSDPDGDPLTYEWKFGDGTTATTPVAVHTYSVKGTYFAVLTVRDLHGGAATSSALRISAGNEPPVVKITQPPPGTVAHPGDTVRFAGAARDPEDGNIPPQNLLWNVKLYHNEHVHPFLNGVRGHSGSFTVPTTAHGGGVLWFRIQLRATDSAGLSNIGYVDVPLKQ